MTSSARATRGRRWGGDGAHDGDGNDRIEVSSRSITVMGGVVRQERDWSDVQAGRNEGKMVILFFFFCTAACSLMDDGWSLWAEQ